MFKRTFNIIVLIIFAGCFCASSLPKVCFAQSTSSHEYFLGKGRSALDAKRYEEALIFFEAAAAADPSDTEIRNYMNLIIRFLDNQVEDVRGEEKPLSVSEQGTEEAPQIEDLTEETEAESIVVPSQKAAVVNPAPLSPVSNRLKSEVMKTSPVYDTSTSEAIFNDIKYQVLKILLDQEAWDLQPNTSIDMALDTKIVFHSTQNIDRFLVIEPNVLEVERIGSNEIVITPKMLGKTFFHVWEPDRRWTFSVSILRPTSVSDAAKVVEDERQTSVKPFYLKYDVSYSTYTSGQNLGGLERDSYSLRQWIGLYGPTPYGDVDTNVSLYKTQDNYTKAISYAFGLTDAKIGSFQNFNLHLFDMSKSFSPLTLPGRSMRGVLLEGTAFDKQLEYAILRGRDRSSFGDLSPGSQIDSKDSYVDGFRLAYIPQEGDKVAFNYARASGKQKPEFAADKTYSIELEKQLSQEWDMRTEVAYNDNVYASYLSASYEGLVKNATISLRQIPTDYETVTGPSGGQGEVGLQANYALTKPEYSWTTFIDIYRDRTNKNPSDPNAPNFDFNSSFFMPLSQVLNWRSSLYVIHTPGLSSDQTDYRVSSGLDRLFRLPNGRNLTLSFLSSFQQSRYDSNPSSDYDRLSASPSLHVELLDGLNASAGYDFYYVTDKGNNDETSTPEAFTSTLSYYKAFTDKWSGSASVYYRNEEDTEAEKSFLSGQDSLTRSLNFTFKPNKDVSIYCDASLRDVWAEQSDGSSYTEADLRFGMRSDWNLGVAWNPKGAVRGYVFKDINGNGVRDDNEPGLAGVRVNVGEVNVVTDEQGWYYADVAAKSVRVGVDYQTLPKGFVVEDLSMEPVNIVQNYIHSVDIAILSQSGIYGTVFVDDNNNKMLDKTETIIPDVVIVLDDQETAVTDSRGSYFFNNIADGRHKIKLDINTLPMEYIPAVKLDHDITVTEGTTYILHFPVKHAQ